jgi:hypothetical protein
MTQEHPADPALLEWQPICSGDAQLKLSEVAAGQGTALKMDFNFKGGGGFVVAKHVFKRSMPEEYAVHFRLRGRGAVIQLELKLTDVTGRNVWRHVTKDLQLSPRWKKVTVASREFEFAWGPAGGGSISQLGAVEIAVVASEAAAGTLWIADLRIDDALPPQAPTARASSEVAGFEAARVLAGSGWKPRPEDLQPWIVVDSMTPRTVGGLIIDWLERAPSSGYRLRGSNTGRRWKTLYTAASAGGTRSYAYLPGTRVRLLRLEIREPSTGAAVSLQSFEFSRSIDAFWNNLAKREARGWHPRWLHREQTLWTPIGTSNGTQCALMNTDGMVEVSQGSFSIEPMLWIEERLFTWADVTAREELLEQWQPVPSVIWETADWRLRIQAEATLNGVVRVRYRIENLTNRSIRTRLFVLLRPMQVTPPWQSFRAMGGVSRIHDLEWRDGAMCVNRTAQIVPLTAASGYAAMTFDDGFMARHLATGTLPRTVQAHDPFGFATGAIAFESALQASAASESIVSSGPVAAASVRDEAAFDWGARCAASQWAGNGWAEVAVRAALTATAHILVTRSGPALQPGPRRYTRSWIRDGAMMSAALLRMGHAHEVREFIRWYAPNQRADGFVPCCVDAEGVDWLVEHDSHGQLIAVIADYHRFTSDSDFVRESWTFVDRAVGFIEHSIEPDGLLPISVSHEGYLAQPVHSYWDDFWALRGLRDAAHLARALGREAEARAWHALSTRFAESLFASIEATRARRQLDFIPGSIEWADFDPTATANAIYLFDVPDAMNRQALERTFDIYLTEWRGKRSGAVDWSNYTPYEIRIIGALVRMGRRDAALELLQFFLSDRRPRAWNQWPEIAWRDPKTPAHVGDLPHTWIAGEYVLALRSLFGYEREGDESLIVAAGLAPEWLDGAGVMVDQMPTLYGKLSYSLRRIDSQTLRFQIAGGVSAKLVLRPPLAAPLRSVMVNGSRSTNFDADSATILHTPAEVICSAFQ